jgi:outer membrane lipoprotein-sorting protein
MKIIYLLFAISVCSFSGNKNAEGVLHDMHNRYAGKWYKRFTFNQTTEQYRNDSIVKTSTWYEAIIFPDKFRIDFGDKKDSNAVIYLRDSVYSFRRGKLVRKAFNDDDLTFLLGGMYFYPFDSVKAKIQRQGYDLNKFHEANWQGQPVYVIGASNAAEKTNQLWIDKERLIVLKFIKFNSGEKEEGIFSGHQRFGNGWSETACDFYVNDTLIQKEKYHDCKADTEIDSAIFETYHFVGRK